VVEPAFSKKLFWEWQERSGSNNGNESPMGLDQYADNNE
jgi:hypothetical protein